jgi:hypothetical protein
MKIGECVGIIKVLLGRRVKPSGHRLGPFAVGYATLGKGLFRARTKKGLFASKGSGVDKLRGRMPSQEGAGGRWRVTSCVKRRSPTTLLGWDSVRVTKSHHRDLHDTQFRSPAIAPASQHTSRASLRKGRPFHSGRLRDYRAPTDCRRCHDSHWTR